MKTKTPLHRIVADALLNISPEIIGKATLLVPPIVSKESLCTLTLIYNGIPYPFPIICLPRYKKHKREEVCEECCIRFIWKPKGMRAKHLKVLLFFSERLSDKDKPDHALKTGIYKISVEKHVKHKKIPREKRRGFFNKQLCFWLQGLRKS